MNDIQKEKRADLRKEYRKANRERLNNLSKQHRTENKEYYKQYQIDWCERNKEHKKAQSKIYYEKHKEKIKAAVLARQREARTDPIKLQKLHDIARKYYENNLSVKIANCYRSRINKALKAQKALKQLRSLEVCGCSWNDLCLYLEKQFKEGMTWENHGLWHIDHIRPISSFDLTDEAQLRECFYYTNLQPLWAEENLRKGVKILESQPGC